jgi:hypothetical protein
MARAANHKTNGSSLLAAPLSRLSATMAPFVRDELAGALIAELERHFNQQLLPELHDRVETIVARELEKREAMAAKIAPLVRAELSADLFAELERHFNERLSEIEGRVETIVARELEKHERVLPAEPSSKDEMTLYDRFGQVFHQNLWLDPETTSGPGSRKDSHSVSKALAALAIIKEQINFTSINDIPCGDFNWIDQFLKNAPDVIYKGFDIVPMMIEKNRALHSSHEFATLDITATPPPYADLIFSKDLFNHLLYTDIRKALMNMKKSMSRYLLATNNFGFVNEELYANSGTASRYLDLCSIPLNLPLPIWNTDYLGLWKLSDIEMGPASPPA